MSARSRPARGCSERRRGVEEGRTRAVRVIHERDALDQKRGGAFDEDRDRRADAVDEDQADKAAEGRDARHGHKGQHQLRQKLDAGERRARSPAGKHRTPPAAPARAIWTWLRRRAALVGPQTAAMSLNGPLADVEIWVNA
jgi:hypothetical protein